MRINTNINAFNSVESLTSTQKDLGNSLEKLSSGLRINKASDDASGLAIADKLRTQASSINQAVQNANSAIAFFQIIDRSLAEMSNIFDIIKQKTIQYQTDTTSKEGKDAIEKDVDKLIMQLDNIAFQTNYNGITPLMKIDTSSSPQIIYQNSDDLVFQVGANENDTITIESPKVLQFFYFNISKDDNSIVVGDSSTYDYDMSSGDFLQYIDDDISLVNEQRSTYGSTQNQLESSVRNLMTQYTNIKAAESVIRDVDYAQESASFNRLNILQQAGSFALSQGNNIQKNILQLLS